MGCFNLAVVTSVASQYLPCGNQKNLRALILLVSNAISLLRSDYLVASSYAAGVGILQVHADRSMTYLNCCEIGDVSFLVCLCLLVAFY